MPLAILLHAAVILLTLISIKPQMPMEETASQTPVSIIVENSGATQAEAPTTPLRGPAQLAQVPPAPSAAPAPPPQPQMSEPETDLQIPTDLFSEYNLPPPASQSQPRQEQSKKPTRRSKETRRQYQVMNNMSFGNSSSGAPAPALPNARPGLNLQLSQSDLNALNRPEITVQGEIGSDWMDSFNRWVNGHIYYPRAAVEQNQQGTSVIQFTVHRDGSVSGLRLLSSAGSPFLDQAWLGIFKNRVPPFPPGTKADSIKVTASLEYELVP